MTKDQKTKKSKGPIRLEAVVPFFILIAAVSVYATFFLDRHLKTGLEHLLTQLNGAEVNVSQLRIDFKAPGLEIKAVQFTNPDQPDFNSLVVQEMRFHLLWDALLRAKVVIDDASILGITLGAKRDRPGFVLPPPSPEQSSAKSETAQLKSEVLQQAQKKFSDNVLGDALALLQGGSPESQLNSIAGSLKTKERIKELESLVSEKSKEWKSRIDQLPKTETIQGFEARAKSIKVDGFTNPQEVATSISQIDALYKDVDQTVKTVADTKKALTTEVATLQSQAKDLKSFLDQDLKDLQGRLKLPSLDAKSLSQSLFAPVLLARVAQYQGQIERLKDYLPPPKTPEEKAAFKRPKPKSRSAGLDYSFPVTRSYPKFWLQRSKISTVQGTEGISGDLSGELKNVSSQPEAVSEPLTLDLQGRFPQAKIEGVQLKLTLDRRTPKGKDSLLLKVKEFPVEGVTLASGPDLTLGIEQSTGSLLSRIDFSSDSIAVDASSDLASPQFKVDSQHKDALPYLNGILADVKSIRIDGRIFGPWRNPEIALSSSLGRDLESGFKKQLASTISDARKKLENELKRSIGPDQAALISQVSSLSSANEAAMKIKEAEVNKLKSNLEAQKNKVLAESKSRIQQEGAKALEGLKKKFGF